MDKLTERQVQDRIKKRLDELGITYFSTSANRKSKNSRGTPDLFVHIKDRMYMACEIKGAATLLSKEQRILHIEGKIQVFRDPDVAIDIILFARNLKK